MCKLACGYCRKNEIHNCRICNDLNQHRSKDCPINKSLCRVFGCSSRAGNQLHFCRICKIIERDLFYLLTNLSKNSNPNQILPTDTLTLIYNHYVYIHPSEYFSLINQLSYKCNQINLKNWIIFKNDFNQ